MEGSAFVEVSIEAIHPGERENSKVLVVNKEEIGVVVDCYEEQGETRKHALNILKRLEQHHPNLAIHYFD